MMHVGIHPDAQRTIGDRRDRSIHQTAHVHNGSTLLDGKY